MKHCTFFVWGIRETRTLHERKTWSNADYDNLLNLFGIQQLYSMDLNYYRYIVAERLMWFHVKYLQTHKFVLRIGFWNYIWNYLNQNSCLAWTNNIDTSMMVHKTNKFSPRLSHYLFFLHRHRCKTILIDWICNLPKNDIFNFTLYSGN